MIRMSLQGLHTKRRLQIKQRLWQTVWLKGNRIHSLRVCVVPIVEEEIIAAKLTVFDKDSSVSAVKRQLWQYKGGKWRRQEENLSDWEISICTRLLEDEQ